jgi:D-alanyl-lipoteichoic acid acyltransferase DltB (MBOAT superfamily)
MLTMLLGGLWHGASWNFVIWGGYHGALLSVDRVARASGSVHPLLRPFRIAITFALVTIGWVFFRAQTLPQSTYVLHQMFSFPAGHGLWPRWEFWFAVTLALLAVAEERFSWFQRLAEAPVWVWSAVVATLLLCLETLGVPGQAIPFVYFQF